MHISYSIVQSVMEIPPPLIEQIEELETWTFRDEKIKSQINNILKDKEQLIAFSNLETSEIVNVLCYIGANDLIRLLHRIGENDVKLLKHILYDLNSDEYTDNEMVNYLKSRLFLLYRLSVFPSLFSEENFMILYNTIKEKQSR